MRPFDHIYFILFSVFPYFSFFLKLIITHYQYFQSHLEHFKSIRKVLALSCCWPMVSRAHAGSTRQREVKWGKDFLVIVARSAFAFEYTPIFKRLHETKYATIWNLKNIIVIPKTFAFFRYRFPTLKHSQKGRKHRV